MTFEFANRICPNCKNPNYMVLLGDFSKSYKYKCMNCNRYFNDIDFENEEPELTDRQLDDIAYENKKAYDNGYLKGFHDAKTLEECFVEYGVKIGFLTPEKAELLKEHPQIVRCQDCTYLNADTGICIVGIPHGNKDTFYCAYGKMR